MPNGLWASWVVVERTHVDARPAFAAVVETGGQRQAGLPTELAYGLAERSPGNRERMPVHDEHNRIALLEGDRGERLSLRAHDHLPRSGPECNVRGAHQFENDSPFGCGDFDVERIQHRCVIDRFALRVDERDAERTRCVAELH
jgi:hypothetical protein